VAIGIVNASSNGTPGIRLWSLMTQNIRTKQAEEKWSLHQCNFLAGSRKTVTLACRSEDWIKFQRKAVTDFRRWYERQSEYFLQELT